MRNMVYIHALVLTLVLCSVWFQMVGIYLARTLISDIEKVRYSY